MFMTQRPPCLRRLLYSTARPVRQPAAGRRAPPRLVSPKHGKEPDAKIRRQPQHAVPGPALPRPFRGGGQGRLQGRRIPLSLRAQAARAGGPPAPLRPEAGVVQPVAGRLGRRRARHGRHSRPGAGIRTDRRPGARLCARPRLPAAPRHGRHPAARRAAAGLGAHLCAEPPHRRRQACRPQHPPADRAAEPSRHARLFPEDRRAGPRADAGCGASQHLPADGPLPRPDHGRRPGRAHPHPLSGDPPLPDRRRPRPPRARRRRDQLPLPLRHDRRPRLRRLDRLRIPPARHHARRSGMGAALRDHCDERGEGMKVVITGGAGFIGRQLAERLLALGELPGSGGKPERIDELVLFDAVEPAPFKTPDKRLRTVTGDIADRALVARTIDAATGTVFHLAAVVSAAAEADFDLGMRVNLEGTLAVLEACRTLPQPARLVFTSSIAVFGGDMPPTLTDTTPLTPQTSYGAQKAIGELLVNDYSRKGFVDGRALRLPTIVVRPGKPNKAASTFASSILREPLAGQEAICPVERSARMWILSPRRAVESLLHAHALPTERWGTNRSLTLPGIEVSIGDMVDGLGRVAGKGPVARIKWQPDAHIHKIVAGWPYRFDPSRAKTLGFSPDKTIDEIIQSHIDDQLSGKFAA